MTLKKVLALLLTLALIIAVIPACSNNTDSGTDSTEPPTSDTGDIDYSQVKVVFIPKLLNSYFDTVADSIQDVADELGFEFDYQAPQTAEATSQVEYIEAAIQNGVDVILIGPNSNDALNTYFDDAREKGTKIICLNNDMPGSEEHRDAAIMPADMDAVAGYQLDCLGDQIGYKGEFAIMSAATDTPDQNYWIAGMKELLENDSKYANMKLVEVAYGDEQNEKTTSECEALLAKYPNLKAILAPTGVGLPICAKVVENKGLAGKIVVTGLATPSIMKAYVDSETVTHFQLWDIVKEGRLAGYFAAYVATGQVSTDPGTTFQAGDLGEYTITDNGQLITGPLFDFDASNINDFNY